MERQFSRINKWRETSFKDALGDIWSFALYTFRRFEEDRMSQAAGALTYSSLLALVPLLVIVLAVLSGFPAFDSVRDRVQEAFLGTLVPEVGAEVKTYLSEFATNASNLTAAGVIALAVTAVMLLSTIEATLNRIWRVDRPRPLLNRLLIFWAILTVGPLLLGTSFTLSSDGLALVQNWARETASVDDFSLKGSGLNTVLAILAQSAAFTILFVLVPARHVRLRDAAIGGIFSGLTFQILRWTFNSFLTSGSTYSTIYGAVAAFPIFLVWIYLSWTVIILGAVLSASFPDWWHRRDPLIGKPLSPAETLTVAAALLEVLGRQATSGGTVSRDALAEAVPVQARDAVTDQLLLAGYVVETEDERVSLARDLHVTTVADLARDLGLALGLQDSDGARPGLAAILSDMDGIQVPLRDLKLAEDEVLAAKVADAVSHRSGRADGRTCGGEPLK